jgi:penicillin-binding protein 2
MAGKTGTAQVRRITMAERAAGLRKQEDKPWIERHHALFVGFAPISAPRYAVSVVVEHGGSGSGTAAPVARDLLREAQRLDPLSRLAVSPSSSPGGGSS